MVYFCHLFMVFFGGRTHTTAALPNQTYPGINKPLVTSENGGVLVRDCHRVVVKGKVSRQHGIQNNTTGPNVDCRANIEAL